MKSRILIGLMSLFFVLNLNAQQFRSADPKDISLYPRQNEFRNTMDLSGVWKFKVDSLAIGEKEHWFDGLKKSRSIAVPGSWNDQFDDIRDYLDVAWYEKSTFVPGSWKGQKVFIRVGSANYFSKLWVNGIPVGQHEGGNLPYAFDISSLIKWDTENRISVEIENVLKPSRVPTGGVSGGLLSSFPKANFDFFPFAGLQRIVWLYSVPATSCIRDITVKTSCQDKTGLVDIRVDATGKANSGKVILSGNGQNFEAPFQVGKGTATVQVKIPDVRLWSVEDPFMYSVSVTISEGSRKVDHYSLETGVRTITATNKQILLNGKPVFLKGFGKHEDFPIFGRGTAYPVMIKDFSLLKWVGANSFRTSHYPYDEEYMNMADRQGILVIDEIPAVGLFFHGDTSDLRLRQAICRQYINELVARDKNHPSVIIWSLANEPTPPSISISSLEEKNPASKASMESFTDLFTLVKKLDPTRLTTIIGVMAGPVEWLTFGDVACINRYWGWYTNPGDIQAGARMLSGELDMLYKTLQKPIIVTEFGADTYAGMHSEQPEMFTEEYQRDFIKAYLDVADKKDFVAGMQVWAFADFKTGQGIVRFGGMNYKGVFTRDRKPKLAAFYLKSRWSK
jgi:beta-glucuronidase